MIKKIVAISLALLFTSISVAEEPIATLRNAELLAQPDAPKMNKVENNDVKRMRAYAMQPPTIPHQIREYQIDMQTNKCLFCHSRAKSVEMGAPMVSITHFQNRDGEFLADVSPRRYFCTQCHVPQDATEPLVENEFIDASKLIKHQNSGHK